MDLCLTNTQLFISQDISSMDWRGVDYCDVFIICLYSHSEDTHPLQRIHWWGSNVIQFYFHFLVSYSFKETEQWTTSYTQVWMFWQVNLHYARIFWSSHTGQTQRAYTVMNETVGGIIEREINAASSQFITLQSHTPAAVFLAEHLCINHIQSLPSASVSSDLDLHQMLRSDETVHAQIVCF